ncbi:MAG: DUF4349 domain-containing protein [Erythrobacter sp.]
MRFDKRFGIVPSLGAASLAIVGCSEGASEAGADYAVETAYADADIAEEAADAPADAAAPTISAEGEQSSIPALESPTTLPRIAYTYNFGFSLPAEKIVPLQQRHADMCEAKGSSTCRILSMRGANTTDGDGSGQLQMAVRAEVARSFGAELGRAASDNQAEATATSINGEDLSKQMVDTEARLRARTVLRDRLLETLQTRRGSVAELVQAEREVARVNEEIDQARSWLNEMRGRVAFSRMTVDYGSSTAVGGDFSKPIAQAFDQLGGVMGTVISWLMLLGAVVLPIGVLAWIIMQLGKWIARRRNRAQSGVVSDASSDASSEVA